MTDDGPIIETYAVPDTFVTGSGRVESVGGAMRLVLVSQQTCMDGSQERRVVASIVGTREALQEVAVAILMATEKQKPKKKEFADPPLDASIN